VRRVLGRRGGARSAAGGTAALTCRAGFEQAQQCWWQPSSSKNTTVAILWSAGWAVDSGLVNAAQRPTTGRSQVYAVVR
jgi:hypothetical protein